MSTEPDNFDLTIDQNQDETYRIKARYSRGGEKSVASVTFPIQAGQFRKLVSTLSTRTATAEQALEAGKLMRRHLFPADIWEHFLKCRQKSTDEKSHFRVRLMINAPAVSFLPWEYCCDLDEQAQGAGHLAQRRDMRFVRYIEDENIPHVLDAPRPMKLLIATAQPSGWAELAVQEEADLIEQELAPMKESGLIEIRILHHATIDKIDKEMQPEVFGPHVFHFIGHGQYVFQTQEGGLVLEDENGGEDLVDLARIGSLFKGGTVRVAVLNACKTAAASPDSTQPFMGIAQSLVRAEVPAVFAMQFAVPDAVAKRFARILYERLAAGVPLDDAVSGVRRNAFLNDEKVYWGIPVLFMRSPDGRLWRSPHSLPVATPAAVINAVGGAVTEGGDADEERFRRVMDLDYRAQTSIFRIFRPERFASYLVHGQLDPAGGPMEWGTNLLYLRLRDLILAPPPGARPDEGHDNLKVMPIARTVNRGHGAALWSYLVEKHLEVSGLKGDLGAEDRRKIAAALGEKLAAGHVLFVFHGMGPGVVPNIVTDFWQPLVALMKSSDQLPQTRYGVYAFFIDPRGEIQAQPGMTLLRPPQGRASAANLKATWRAEIPIDLRPVTVFPEDDLERWLESDNAMHLLPADFLDRDIGDAVAEIMENTRNGYPDDAIQYICCDLGSLSVESVEQWLEL